MCNEIKRIEISDTKRHRFTTNHNKKHQPSVYLTLVVVVGKERNPGGKLGR